MQVRFAEADRNFISNQTQQGFYANETEVVRDAVRRLREQKEAQETGMYKAVMKGHKQIEQGLTAPYSRSLIEEIGEEATKRVKAKGKKPYNLEVIPENGL